MRNKFHKSYYFPPMFASFFIKEINFEFLKFRSLGVSNDNKSQGM